MFKRQTTGSVVCRSCGLLVGVTQDVCHECGVRNPGLWGFAPYFRSLGQDLGFVNFLTGSCVILYVVTLALDFSQAFGGGLFGLLSPKAEMLFLFGASGAAPVFGYGRWWTVLSAAWLHGGLLHIGFNMLWVRQLAPATAQMYGAGRMVIIYTAASVVGFGLSSLAGLYLAGVPFIRGAGFTVGASAPIFGLLGALVYSGRRGGSSLISQQAKNYAVILAIFGFLLPGIDNWAHGGGFLGGYLMARWLDPMAPESLNHLVIAVICLALAIGSVVLSVLTGLPLFR